MELYSEEMKKGVNTMARNMLHLLQAIVNSNEESETYKVIARFLLENLKNIDDMSIYDLAEGCFTSNSTISRFAKTLGVSNFIEMKKALAVYKDYGMELSLESLEGLHFDGKRNKEILSTYIEQLCSSLKTMNEISFEAMNTFITLLHDTKNIYIFGTQLSGMFAKHFQLLMMSTGKVIHCCDDSVNHMEMAQSMNSNDLAIIISVDGNYINGNVNVFFSLKKRGVKMALITQNATCKFMSQFDQVLYMGEYTNSKGGRYKLQLMLEMLFNLYSLAYYS